MSSYVAAVVIDQSTLSFDKQYDFAVPENLLSSCLAGCRVVVPFGRGNVKRQGFVISVSEKEVDISLKNVLSVTDKEPVLNNEMLKLVLWLKEHTFCTYFDAIHAVLPTGLNVRLITEYSVKNEDFTALSGDEKRIAEYILSYGVVTAEKISKQFGLVNAEEVINNLVKKDFLYKDSNPIRKIGDATIKMARLVSEDFDSIKLTHKQKTVVDLLLDVGILSVKEITYFTGVGTVVINNLAKYGIIELFDNEVYRRPELHGRSNSSPISLTDSQSEVYNTIREKIDSSDANTVLLHGVTGSGKTQIFLKLAKDVINSGRGVIVMVPEIALTPQMLDIFYSYFGEKVAVFHSALPLGQRLDEWKRVKNGDALIALGTRSAIFAPFNNLGLIVMDEEQEHTYKSEQSPRFHTRDIARFRAAYHKGTCLLCSATPSVESYTAAKSGKYTLCTLNERYGNAVLPEVVPIDMRSEAATGNKGNISMLLAEEISKTLDEKKQVILLLNRRGHNTYISCPSCGYVATCKNCSVSMTYHSASGRLMCHYCGYSEPYSTTCPSCGGNHLKYSGAGTQRLEDELSLLYPNARILRLDADTTMTKNAYRDKLSAFAAGEYDILLGTQMVAKGLNFPNVTLVGVLSADQTMHSGDFRGYERTFSLLTQVVGRSGRGESPGKAYIQTLDPENTIIKLAAAQDYEAFYNEEIATRKLMIYPPYCDIVTMTTAAVSQSTAASAAETLVDILKQKISSDYSDVKVIILRPIPTSVVRVNNKYRYRIVIKCKNNARTRCLLSETIEEYFKTKYGKTASVSVDVNPESGV